MSCTQNGKHSNTNNKLYGGEKYQDAERSPEVTLYINGNVMDRQRKSTASKNSYLTKENEKN